MRKKLTAKQKYNHDYYQAHKGEKTFESRRAKNAKAYRAKASTKERRNKRLRDKWATDAQYRKHVSEYQKAWRKQRNLKTSQNGIVSARKGKKKRG